MSKPLPKDYLYRDVVYIRSYGRHVDWKVLENPATIIAKTLFDPAVVVTIQEHQYDPKICFFINLPNYVNYFWGNMVRANDKKLQLHKAFTKLVKMHYKSLRNK